MVAFYNAADQELYKDYQFVPQEKYRTGFTAPVQGGGQDASTPSFGIPNTNAFTNSVGDGFNQSGNAFGYGSAVNPVALGSYDDPSYFGGLPGNVQQYGLPRNFMYDMDPNYKGNEFMTAYQMTTGKNKELPSFLNAALGFIPGGSFLRGKIEKGLNDPRIGGPSYKIGGMDNTQKGLYNALAGEQMLFDGPGGIKTLTGKNFTGKGYLEGQIDIYNKEFTKPDGTMMTEEEITDLIATTKGDPRKQFKYSQMLEAAKVFRTNKQQEKFTAEQLDKQLAVENEAAANRGRIESYTGRPMSDYRASRPRSEQNYTGGDTNSNPSTPGAQDSFSNKSGMGRTGYFFGGRVNYKAGGRTDAESQYGADSVGSYDSSQNKSGRQQSYGGDNNNDGGNNPPPTFYNNGVQVITDRSKFGFNYPTGLTKNLGVGQLTAILDARKSLEEEEPEGMIQYDSSLGPIDTTMSYDTTTGPEFNATYSNNNLNANYNTKTGLGVNYSKDIGPGTFTAGGTYNPDGTYNTEAKYGISFANGGLAGLI